MTPPKTGTTNADLVLAELIDEIMTKQRRGEPVSLADYAAKYPDHVQQLQDLLPALSALADLSQSVCPDGTPRSRASGEARAEHAEELGGTLGDFRIKRQIGRGGMGIVFEAEQITLRRRVALKVLPFAAILEAKQLQRFRNEAQAAAALDHPNIVSVYWVGCDRGVHYYAMQYIDGRTLAQVIEELREKQAVSSGQRAVGSGQEAEGSGQEQRRPLTLSPPHPVTLLPRHALTGLRRDPAGAPGSRFHEGLPSRLRVLPLGCSTGHPGGRGPGTRPPDGCRPPRHQALEPDGSSPPLSLWERGRG